MLAQRLAPVGHPTAMTGVMVPDDRITTARRRRGKYLVGPSRVGIEVVHVDDGNAMMMPVAMTEEEAARDDDADPP